MLKCVLFPIPIYTPKGVFSCQFLVTEGYEIIISMQVRECAYVAYGDAAWGILVLVCSAIRCVIVIIV